MAWFIERATGEKEYEYLYDVELNRWTTEPLKARYFRSYIDAEKRIKRTGGKVIFFDSVTRCFPSHSHD